MLQETAKYLGHGICDNLSKSSTTNVCDDSETIFKEVKVLYDKLNLDFAELRGIGIQLSKLEKLATLNPAMENFLKNNTSKTETTAIKTNEPKVAVNTVVIQTNAKGRGRKKQTPIKAGTRNVMDFFKNTKGCVSTSTNDKVSHF